VVDEWMDASEINGYGVVNGFIQCRHPAGEPFVGVSMRREREVARVSDMN